MRGEERVKQSNFVGELAGFLKKGGGKEYVETKILEWV